MNEEELEIGTLRSKKIQNGIQKGDLKGGSKGGSKRGSKRGFEKVYGAKKENHVTNRDFKIKNF